MGGAVSSGIDNNQLVDNLMIGNYIRCKKVEQVFRALDRALYMTPESWDHAYKDLAWRNGHLHLSSPCIYSEVMEALDLSKGLSFLNIGSGTGYLSSLAGLILGSRGINHGVELRTDVYEYSLKKLTDLLESNPIIDDFDFCVPKFFHGNGLCLEPLKTGYDRVYCGAACPHAYEGYLKNLLKVGGILVMPANESLVKVLRVNKTKWKKVSLLNVTFETLRTPSREEMNNPLKLDEHRPPRLEELSRGVVRAALREGVLQAHPELRERICFRPLRVRPNCPRRISIPVDQPAVVEGLNVLHDLDAENGADEMNSLLSLVISMSHNRVAGALRFDSLDTPSTTSSESHASNDDQDSDDDSSDSDHNQSNQGLAVRFNNTGRNSNNHDSDDDEDPRPGTRPQKRLKKKTNTRNSKLGAGQGSQTRSRNTRTQKRNTRNGATKTKKSAKSCSAKTEVENSDRVGGDAASETTTTTAPTEDLPSTSQGGSGASRDDTAQNNKRKSDVSQENSRHVNESGRGSSNEGSPAKSPSQVDMDCNESKTDKDASDEDDKNMAKRQKLDSGIGGSPGSSSPAKLTNDGDNSEDSVIDEDEGEDDEEYEDEQEGEDENSDDDDNGNGQVRRAPTAPDPRVVRMSSIFRRNVLELPLPPPLQRYINFNRHAE